MSSIWSRFFWAPTSRRSGGAFGVRGEHSGTASGHPWLVARRNIWRRLASTALEGRSVRFGTEMLFGAAWLRADSSRMVVIACGETATTVDYRGQRSVSEAGAHSGQRHGPSGTPPANMASSSGPSIWELSKMCASSARVIASASSGHSRA
jgi:hypothetical protein